MKGLFRRVVLGVSIAIGIAAAIALVVVLAGTSRKTLGPSPVVTQPINTVPQPTTGPSTTLDTNTVDTNTNTSTPTTEPVATLPDGQPGGVTVTNADWDGAGARRDWRDHVMAQTRNELARRVGLG